MRSYRVRQFLMFSALALIPELLMFGCNRANHPTDSDSTTEARLAKFLPSPPHVPGEKIPPWLQSEKNKEPSFKVEFTGTPRTARPTKAPVMIIRWKSSEEDVEEFGAIRVTSLSSIDCAEFELALKRKARQIGADGVHKLDGSCDDEPPVFSGAAYFYKH